MRPPVAVILASALGYAACTACAAPAAQSPSGALRDYPVALHQGRAERAYRMS